MQVRIPFLSHAKFRKLRQSELKEKKILPCKSISKLDASQNWFSLVEVEVAFVV
jgi:hypothetical protein